MAKNILCADIGGTHTRFAHFTLEKSSLHLQQQHIYPTKNLHTTHDVLAAAVDIGLSPEQVHFFCLGVAGLITTDGLCAQLSNATLQLDFRHYDWIHKNTNFLLVNDFALQAWASLAENIELLPLACSPPLSTSHLKRQTRGILGAGTGLGAAALLPCSYKQEGWNVLSSEGGHVDMAFYGQEEQDFVHFTQDFLQQKRLSAEDVLSARGLSLLHAYVHGQKLSPKDAAAFLWENGQESLQAQLYSRFLGRFCRHWVLNTLCKGGLYLGGGVLIKNVALVQSNSFHEEFYTASSTQLALLKEIPLFLMQHPQAGLWGAAHLAKMHITS